MTAPDEEAIREVIAGTEALSEGLVALESDPDRETVDELFRVAHSVKGTCSMANLEEGAALAHALEDVLDAIRAGRTSPSETVVDDALATVDDLESVVEAAADRREVPVDVDERIAVLEDRLDREGATAEEDDDAGSRARSERPDLTPEEALELASEFDDLDELVAEMEDDAEEFDELQGGGTFAELTAGERGDRSESASESAGDGFVFEQVKSEVESDDIDELERDLAEVEFGEFDDDDEMTIDELLELDPASGDPVVEARSEDSGEAATEGSPRDSAEPDRPAHPDATADSTAGANEDGAESTPTSTAEDRAEPESPTPAESESPSPQPTSAGEGSVADAEPGFEFTSTDELAGRKGDDAVDATDEEQPAEAADPVGDWDEPQPPGSEDGDQFATADESGGRDGSETEGPASAEAETEPTGANGVSDTPVDAAAAGESSPGSADLDDLVGEMELDDLVGEELDASAEPGIGPDAPFESDPFDDADVEFRREESLDEFEARFANIFEDLPDEDESRVSPATTIEESSADTEQFPRAFVSPGVGDGVDTVESVQSVSVDVETADRLLNLVEELSMARFQLADAVESHPESLEEPLADVTRVAREFRQTVVDVRLLPFERATNGLSRVLRDAARVEEKEVALETDGEDVRLDREVIDRIGPPLVHLVRNAVAHGVEPPAEREAAGKPREGTVTVGAERERERVVIEVADDGRGIDRDVVVDRAVERGLVDRSEATDLSRDDLHDLLFGPGFTTRTEVSETSGRGVGLDVVHRTVSDLDGSVEVESTPGEGTTVRISLPVTVAVTELLFVRSGSEFYAIPATDVAEVTPVAAVQQLEDGTVRRRQIAADRDEDGEDESRRDSRPVMSLAETFGTDGSQADEESVVWIGGDRPLALRCEEVTTARESLVEPYSDMLGDVPGISGAAMRGDGDLVNVIDVRTI